MGEDREVELQDKRGTKDCPDLFANVVMLKANTMATVAGKSHRKVSVYSLSRTEAVSLHKQLGELFDKEAKEEECADAPKNQEEANEIAGEDEAKAAQGGELPKGVKDGSAENVESNKESKEEVGTQEQTETAKDEGSNSEGQSQANKI